jgi:predicted amidophosphoribosyltransferase
MKAFRVGKNDQQELQGKTVCLIDDVWTTGATLKACTETLKAAGVQKVYVLTLARVIPDG